MKQAVVILHGMGEQIPMQTLEAFVQTLWTEDPKLVSRYKPDPETGGERTHNVSWGKPDPRTHSYEVRRITTEQARDKSYTDFYEFYWAHLMHGTTWQHVQSWLIDLLWRNPIKRVPPRVRLAWGVLWLITLAVGYFTIQGMLPSDGTPAPAWKAVASGIGGILVATFVSNVLIKRFGDVARYVKATPPNVARRQEIREKGVALLEELMTPDPDSGEKPYDRIIVVAHSLGTIVAYDILTQLFARHNKLPKDAPVQPQPEREKLEEMIRAAAGLRRADGSRHPPQKLDLTGFQAQQAAALHEAQDQGLRWNVTDFVTLGAPLTHAEFLMSEGRDDLRDRQRRRILPTCPPMLELNLTTDLHHYSYRTGRDGDEHRQPHHAAPFAYTRWTNLYSGHRALILGDIISGPVGGLFGLTTADGTGVSGIRDVSVLPAEEADGRRETGFHRMLLTHNSYWNLKRFAELRLDGKVPQHIKALRDAVRILG